MLYNFGLRHDLTSNLKENTRNNTGTSVTSARVSDIAKVLGLTMNLGREINDFLNGILISLRMFCSEICIIQKMFSFRLLNCPTNNE